jgi:hypothetical protein
MMKKIACTLTILVLILFVAGSPVRAAMISVSPVSQNATEGTPVTIDVVISDMVDGAPSLGAFDLDVTFDPAILRFNTVSFGDPSLGDQLDLLGLGSSTGFEASTLGMVNLYEVSLDTVADLNNLQADTLVLFSLTFDTLGEGISAVGLADVKLGDAQGFPFEADLGAGSVTVSPGTPVPLPAALLLFGSGLIGGSLVRRRKTRE